MSALKTTHTKSLTCDRYQSISVGKIRALIQDVPDDAMFKISGAYSDQREGDFNGNATVTWED